PLRREPDLVSGPGGAYPHRLRHRRPVSRGRRRLPRPGRLSADLPLHLEQPGTDFRARVTRRRILPIADSGAVLRALCIRRTAPQCIRTGRVPSAPLLRPGGTGRGGGTARYAFSGVFMVRLKISVAAAVAAGVLAGGLAMPS